MDLMLATAADALPREGRWGFEFKWDGVRALVEVSEGRWRMHSRAGNEITIAYPELAGLGEGLDDALIDGEVVATGPDGRPSFERLQSRMHIRDRTEATRLARTTPVTFIAFDLLRLYGVALTDRSLQERRATLERLVAQRPGWTMSPMFDDGPATEAAAREHGLEGVVAKRLDSRYRPGRSSDWVKVKFFRSSEFVVAGWEADPSTPNRPSSLLIAYYDGPDLIAAGKVGSGLRQGDVDRLLAAFVPRDRPATTVSPPSRGRPVTWVEPTVVIEVQFSDWTEDGRARHPVFLGIRNDKSPREVVRVHE